MEKYLKESEAAEYLGVSSGTMRNWRSAGAGPKFLKPTSALVRYTIADLDEFMRQQWGDGL